MEKYKKEMKEKDEKLEEMTKKVKWGASHFISNFCKNKKP